MATARTSSFSYVYHYPFNSTHCLSLCLGQFNHEWGGRPWDPYSKKLSEKCVVFAGYGCTARYSNPGLQNESIELCSPVVHTSTVDSRKQRLSASGNREYWCFPRFTTVSFMILHSVHDLKAPYPGSAFLVDL